MNLPRILFFVGLLAAGSLAAQTLTSSNLPIVIINMDGNAGVPDEPKAPGTMKIIYAGVGQRNFTNETDPAKINYNGRIKIEIRGSSSSTLPKKQYSLTTVKNDNVTNNNVSLLGMPAENDWILSGLAFDASYMRDYLSFNLSRAIGQYAPRTQYCELILNGDYRGIYMLVEKIKVDDNRVNVVKIDATDNTLPDVSGGYITKSDKVAGVDVPAWNFDGTDFIHEVPKANEVTTAQNNYISSVFFQLKNKAFDQSILSGYPSVIDVPSFIDFMLINEQGSNADAYQFSTYFHKDKNNKLRAGPIWDLNLTYGYDLIHWGLDRVKTDVWQFNNVDNIGPNFWRDLFNDFTFKCLMARRYSELRQPGQPLNQTVTFNLIDATVALLTEASAREHQRWDDEIYTPLYTNVGLNPNFSAQVSVIKNFITTRQSWMATQMGSFSSCSNVATPPLVITRIDYRPAQSATFTNSSDQEFIEIMNTGNAPVTLTGMYFGGTGFVYQFPANVDLPAQGVIQLANRRETFTEKFGFNPFGQFTRNLNDAGQKLQLLDAFGNVIDEVTYSNESPWPNANGNGNYLKLIDTSLDNKLATSWTVSNEPITTTITSTEDKNLPIHVYPNPTTGIINITAEQSISIIEVRNAQGQLIGQQKGYSKQELVDLTKATSGLYTLLITTDSKTIVKKVLKR